MPLSKGRGSPSGPLKLEGKIVEFDLGTLAPGARGVATAAYSGLRTTDVVLGVNPVASNPTLGIMSVRPSAPGVIQIAVTELGLTSTVSYLTTAFNIAVAKYSSITTA